MADHEQRQVALAAGEVRARAHGQAGRVADHEDRRRLARLRGLSEAQWAASAGRAPAFDDERLDEVVWRYRARNFPATLTDEERARWQAHCAARLIEGQAGAMTLQRFQERIDALAAEREDDEAAMDLLGALVDYGEQIAPEAD